MCPAPRPSSRQWQGGWPGAATTPLGSTPLPATWRLSAEGIAAGRTLGVVPLRDQILGVAAPALRLLVLAAALVLLLALADLANLMTARVSAREREFSVRVALGARPGATARILLTETAVLTVAGAGLGVALAQLGITSLNRFASEQLPLGEQIRIDVPVLAFTTLLVLLVTLVLALAPLAILRRHTPEPLAAAGSGPTARRSRIRRALVMSQVAAALLLLVGEAAVLRSLFRLLEIDLGYRTKEVVAVDLNVYRHPGGRPIYAELVRRVSDLPGVEAVGAIHSIPLTGKWTFREPLIEAGRPAADSSARLASGNFVAFNYFTAMQIALLAGRDFTETEYQSSRTPAIIINRTAAERFFPKGALGRVVQLAGTPRTIVGIVEDTRDVRIDLETEPQWYLPGYFEGSQLMVRTSAEPAAMVEPIRKTVTGTDPNVVIHRIEPLEAIATATLFERRLAVGLLGVVGALALVIAAVGIYGVLNGTVNERQRELGVRMAVGASPARLLAMVLWDGLVVAGAGVAIGLALTVPLRGAVSGLLYRADPAEPVLLLGVAGGLLLVALLACLEPAWRAGRVDAAEVLKSE
jgi:putative ABC transport system permease protein